MAPSEAGQGRSLSEEPLSAVLPEPEVGLMVRGVAATAGAVRLRGRFLGGPPSA